jgi:hypothetical protein
MLMFLVVCLDSIFLQKKTLNFYAQDSWKKHGEYLSSANKLKEFILQPGERLIGVIASSRNL